jgi:motility quorum-sensing regulator/GCU-specific mRNA interferase toxin
MEKHKPHYNLDEIKQAFSDADNLGNMTGSARNGIRALNFSDEDVVNVVQSLSMREFHKSMTSQRDHTIWQDVYYPKYRAVELYVKFTRDEDDKYYLLISFKQSDEQ